MRPANGVVLMVSGSPPPSLQSRLFILLGLWVGTTPARRASDRKRLPMSLIFPNYKPLPFVARPSLTRRAGVDNSRSSDQSLDLTSDQVSRGTQRPRLLNADNPGQIEPVEIRRTGACIGPHRRHQQQLADFEVREHLIAGHHVARIAGGAGHYTG